MESFTEIFNKDGNQVEVAQIIKLVARHIHYDLALKAKELSRKYPLDSQALILAAEQHEIRKLWEAMDVIEEHYLEKQSE